MSGEGIDTLPLPLFPSLRGGEADEAIQGPRQTALDCFAALYSNDGVENPDKVSLAGPFQPHDLLGVDPAAVGELSRDLPGWAATSLVAIPWVVMRRAMTCDGLLPVGIRGSDRSERCAAWLAPAAVVERRTPEDLASARAWRTHPRRAEISALAVLDAVATLLAASDWGPAGSIGFELATGRPTANPDSDLDIVLRAPGRVGPGDARRLLTALAKLPVRVDIAVEAPLGACSLAEIAAGGTVVVKTRTGPRLVRDPWAGPVA